MRKSGLSVLGIAAILFAACTPGTSSGPGDTGGSTSNTPAPPPSAASSEADLIDSAYQPEPGTTGGQLLFGDWQEANQLNPYYIGQQTEANVASAVWATLVVFTSNAKYAPDLATQIPSTTNGGVKVPGVNGDAMTVTWTLKPDLAWSDGQPLTCDDFKYAWQWVLDPTNTGLAGGTAGFDQITAIDCPDPSTIVLHFKSIYEGYITMFSAPLPRHYLSQFPIADQVKGAGFHPDEVKNVPVSGAFKYDSLVSGSQLTLVRNDHYKGFRSNKRANLDSLVFKWYGDADAMIAGFAAGEVDVATDLQDSDLPKLEQQGLHDSISAIPALLYEFLRPNWADGSHEDPATGVGGCSRNPAVQDRGTGCPVADPAIRQAIAYAVDKNAINTRLLGGTAVVANSAISPQAWFFSQQPPSTYDPDKANQILDQAGWVKGSDGIRSKNGLRAKIELCTTTRQVRIDTLTLISNELKDIGIESVVNAVDPADIFAGYNEGTKDTPCDLSRSNFDLAEHAFTSSPDPLGNYFNYHSSQFSPNGANAAQINDPDIDKALDEVKGSVDFSVIKQAMATFQQVYNAKVVEIPLYYRKQVDLFSAKVGNFYGNPTQAGPTWNAVDWFLKG
jgi:peptide/nickel transport system substrate-binding protein